jgi:FKBP-type peptidyl-prolyl cis-trans isomerase FklB
MRYLVPAITTLAILAATPVGAEEYDDKEKFSYTMGYQMGLKLRQGGADVDPAAFATAIEDALAGTTPKMTNDEMRATFEAEKEKRAKAEQERADANRKRGEEFLAENKDKEGVQVLESGVQYIVIEEGEGDSPAADDTVEVHYRGTLIDGTEFDSSYERGSPATFKANGVIKGFQEALTHMKEGAKWKVFIPSELAYGESGAGNTIGPNETLIFDLELLAVK